MPTNFLKLSDQEFSQMIVRLRKTDYTEKQYSLVWAHLLHFFPKIERFIYDESFTPQEVLNHAREAVDQSKICL